MKPHLLKRQVVLPMEILPLGYSHLTKGATCAQQWENLLELLDLGYFIDYAQVTKNFDLYFTLLKHSNENQKKNSLSLHYHSSYLLLKKKKLKIPKKSCGYLHLFIFRIKLTEFSVLQVTTSLLLHWTIRYSHHCNYDTTITGGPVHCKNYLIIPFSFGGLYFSLLPKSRIFVITINGLIITKSYLVLPIHYCLGLHVT